MTRRSADRSRTGRLRIVAGKWRSRLLDIADVPGLRPTPERVRETLFNWLSPSIEGARCLDLFAGTGALGLEALSRGAAAVVFIENSPKAAVTLEKNIARLGGTGATVRRADALEYLRRPAESGFDIVFLDPPFAADKLDELCRLIGEASILAAGARIYVEEDRHKSGPLLPSGWQTIKSRTAGNVRYSLVGPGT
jgi:16S rRNA (guanine966-N2)-methyltransferase